MFPFEPVWSPQRRRRIEGRLRFAPPDDVSKCAPPKKPRDAAAPSTRCEGLRTSIYYVLSNPAGRRGQPKPIRYRALPSRPDFQNDRSASGGRSTKSMPWMTPLSASISGSTTIATAVSSWRAGTAEESAPERASCRVSTAIADAGIASLFGSARRSTSVMLPSSGTTKRTPGGHRPRA
jgi:hypothetical protein